MCAIERDQRRHEWEKKEAERQAALERAQAEAHRAAKDKRRSEAARRLAQHLRDAETIRSYVEAQMRRHHDLDEGEQF
jgi:hypothetical protein